MKIISWDIGSENLAFCILDTETGRILDWRKIDILAKIRPKVYPCSIDGCSKKTFFRREEIYFCKVHAKKKPNLIEIATDLNGERCGCKNKNGRQCKSRATAQSLDIPVKLYCKKHSHSTIVKTKPYHTIKKITFEQRCKYLWETLEELRDVIFGCEIVAIENQPVYKNPIMKSIQMIVYSFYLAHSYLDKIDIDIQLINASNKLKIYNGPAIECKIKDKHSRNKEIGKQQCLYFLEKHGETEWLQKFMAEKKKDDYADSYLQALFVMKQLSYPTISSAVGGLTNVDANSQIDLN